MARDLAMIFSVVVAVVSVGFGLYKNIEAGNARGFAYEQSYKVMDAVQQANISTSAKAGILDIALDSLATPPPVIDLSRSSADQPEQACPGDVRATCEHLGAQLGRVNAACEEAKDAACEAADPFKREIITQGCIACYRQP